MSTKPDVESPNSKNLSTLTIQDASSSIHIKLDGINYRVWSKILQMHIAGRKKKGYINGKKAAPAVDDSSYDEWEAEDSLVKSWLINSMSDNMISHFVQCGTTKEVWDAVKRSYLDVSDSSEVYELMKKTFHLQQDGRPLAEYYNELNSTFMELDYRRPNDMTCAADKEKYRNRIAEDRVYIFLAGLDNKLDQVRSRVLGTSPLPRLEEVYSMVRRELQRQVAMGAESHFEASALTVQKSTPIVINGNSTASQSRFCTYCNKNTHTIDVCWKKHGYPEWYKLKQAERKNKKLVHNTVAQNVAAIDTTPSSVSHVSRASSQEGIFGLSDISAHPSTWIIDSGATDHMTSNSSIIDSLTSSPVKSVQVANGNFTPIIGAGNVSLSPKFSMSSDNLTKMTIGIGKERDGLYYWEDNRSITISTRGIENAKENGNSLVLDDGQENKIETNSERPAHFFEKGYSRRTKDITVMPPGSCTSLNDNTSLDDTTMLSNESSKIDTKNRRYPLRERKEPDRLGFSKASNEALDDPKWKDAMVEEMMALQKNSTWKMVELPMGKKTEALDDPMWKDAMVEEMMAFQKNSTWEMVELPMRKKTVGCKWVFSVKYKSDGTVERYKTRLVAKGYTQTYGIDYQETFAPVAKMNTVRVILSLAVNLDWTLRQFDVKNAFLHGELTEEVFMDPSQGFTLEEGKVCRLKKALYGLKQSPRAWFGRLSHAMEEFGFKQASADHTLFYKRNYNDITVLLVYVDDMIVTGNNKEEIENFRSYLAKEFEIKDLGTLKYFLGIEVSRSKQGLFLSQRKYTLELLAETGMSACEPIDTPIEVNHGLAFFSDQIPTNKERYQRIMGRLIYLTYTRPDLAYAVSVVSQFMHNPSDQHMNAVNRILAYLKSAPGKGVLFSKHEHFDVVGYTDSDFAGSKLDRKSTSGYLAFVGGNLMSWKSKKQNVVSLSSAEAEYRAMHHAITELSWLKILLKEIGFSPKGSMVLFCDNMAAIKIANNPIQHDRTKHVEIDRNYIKDNLDFGTIEIPYTRSSDQLADIMTHAVISSLFNASLSKLGICDIYAPT
ncbi:uncharacterized protein [Coffea arabica]|uniref:Reverse transcriptase Ty1/copia-type domain-containing protein n=1 Tax=Coffea arabica TaxID=13443 RepID=A0ABM4U6I2_COFAR